MNSLRIRNVRIVHLDCPYRNWTDETGDLFAKMVSLKIKGYMKEYPYGVLPVDTSDFIATHHLVCLETKRSFVPLMGYKTTTLERSLDFNITFPGLALVKAANAPEHTRAVEGIIAECKRDKIQLGYTGSWTIDPLIRQDKAFTTDLVGLFTAMYVRYPIEHKIARLIAGGTPRFKTERLIHSLGHDPLSLKGKVLPSISVAHLHQEEVLVMYLKQFTSQALAIAETWSRHWDQRVYLGFDEIDRLTSLKKAG